MEKILFNAEEASYALGISKSTLFRLTKANKITKVQVSDQRVAWAKSDIMQFINLNRK